MKFPFIIYADLDSLLEKINTSHNNPKKSSTTKTNKPHLLVIHCLHIANVIKQKISLIIIEKKIA